MGTVRKIVSVKTGRESWQIDYLDPDGKRIRKNFKKRKDAKAHLAKYENDMNNGEYVDMYRVSVPFPRKIVDTIEYKLVCRDFFHDRPLDLGLRTKIDDGWSEKMYPGNN